MTKRFLSQEIHRTFISAEKLMQATTRLGVEATTRQGGNYLRAMAL